MLIIVLWAVAALSVITTNFAFMVKTHVRIASNYANDAKLRAIARSGVESAIAALDADLDPLDSLGEEWADSEDLFAEHPVGAGFFTLTRDAADGESAVGYGMEDEASKVNLLTATPEMLIELEGMDETLVDALIDWQDEDSDASPNGAEHDYYESLPEPYFCKNASLDTVAELLLVRGFEPSVVFGEDWNLNGILDPNEDDGDGADPPDNQDGYLDRGIYPFVTIYSSDKNIDLNDEKRVDISSADESTLQSSLGLKEDEARAIVAWRGKHKFEHVGDLLKVVEAPPKTNSNSRKSDSAGRSSKGKGAKGKAGKPAPSNIPESTTPAFNVGRVQEFIDGCAVNGEEIVVGRVNINTAPEQVLATLPGIDEEIASAIVTYRRTGGGFESIGGLLNVAEVEQEVFIAISDLLTVRSYQFRIQSTGWIEDVKARRTITAVVDRSDETIETMYWQEQ